MWLLHSLSFHFGYCFLELRDGKRLAVYAWDCWAFDCFFHLSVYVSFFFGEVVFTYFSLMACKYFQLFGVWCYSLSVVYHCFIGGVVSGHPFNDLIMLNTLSSSSVTEVSRSFQLSSLALLISLLTFLQACNHSSLRSWMFFLSWFLFLIAVLLLVQRMICHFFLVQFCFRVYWLFLWSAFRNFPSFSWYLCCLLGFSFYLPVLFWSFRRWYHVYAISELFLCLLLLLREDDLSY